MKKNHAKLLSLLLMMMLVINYMMPTAVHATDHWASDEYISPENIVENDVEVIKEPKDPAVLQQELDELTYEITSLRGENVKHFQLPDGTYQAVVYGEPVHRRNADGKWEEIDNTLTEANGVITTNDSRVKFAKKITANGSLYTLHNGNYKVMVGLSDAQKKVEGVVTTVSDSEAETTKLQQLIHVDHISSSVRYNNILEGIDLEYIIVSNSIKENIIVKEPSDNYNYTFTLNLNGLTAELDNGNILLCDSSSGDVIYCIPAPYMYDDAGNESVDVYYTLTSLNNGKYEFTLSADSQWINSTDRSFPVVIDPSLFDIGQIDDTYVTSQNTTGNFGGTHALLVSSAAETYYKFATPNLPDGTHISKATVKFPYYFDSATGSYINVNLYQITSNWNEDSVTWNTKPSLNSTSLATAKLYANNASALSPEYALFTVTDYVRSWYTGTANRGFALKRASGTASSVKFVAKEKLQTFAQLIITYTGTHLAEGVYAIERSGSDYYFKSYYNTNGLSWLLQDTTSYTNPPLTTSNLENLFKISYRPEHNDYVIRSMLNSALIVYPSVGNNAPIAGTRSESDSQLSTNYTWNIEYTGGYYYITHTKNGTKYYIQSASTKNNDNLKLTTNAGDSGTKWKFYEYTGNVYEDIKLEKFKNQLTVGEKFQYAAYMRSTRIGHNGPVSYSITNTDRTATDKATIDSSSGSLNALKTGQIQIRMTYNGAPWVWIWTVTIRTAGCKPYYTITNGSSEGHSMNCQGYAFWTHDKPWDWYSSTQMTNIYNISENSNNVLYGVDNVPGLKKLLEDNWLKNVFSNKWEEVYSSDGGWAVVLDDDQWLIAFRVGVNFNYAAIDYHFWYRTDTGEWANKHGWMGTGSELLGDDLPTDDDSPGWANGANFPGFYDSDIIYYVITE